ncbi:MAG: CHASE2 domain-containing protein [Proteobacteria bacterium]|nr:CHASE2 domain-containing protein [Pseudomonadota bacterium]
MGPGPTARGADPGWRDSVQQADAVSSQRLRFTWIKRWAENIWAALAAVWCFTWSLVVEEKKETEQQNGGRCPVKKEFRQGYLFTVLLLLALWALDPIGVASNSARGSAELFYRIISPAYPPPPAPENAGSGRESNDPPRITPRIAVIIINDETLQTREPKVAWPPPFSLHAEIIGKILIYNPKALFIDFGFFDERKDAGLDELVKALKWRLSEPAGTKTACVPFFRKPAGCYPDDGKVDRKVPVFLAGAPRPFDRGEEPYKLEIIPALKAEVTGTVSTRYSTEHELPYNSYPLYDCFTREPSAALAIYAAFLDDWTTWGLDRTPCRDQAQRTARDWAGGSNGMSIYWASWGDANHSRGSYRCRTLPETRFGRVAQVVWIWVRDLFQDDKAWREQFQACPPHLSYAAHDFLVDESAELAEFMQDRYVFYGGNFAMADDLITPPTHEPVPGVFLHAMALDNLIQRGGDTSA